MGERLKRLLDKVETKAAEVVLGKEDPGEQLAREIAETEKRKGDNK